MATLFQEEKVSRPIGENVTRVEAHEKVIGAALFADDLQFGPGLLFARIKRSPHPHALIKRIDVSKARELPGVKAVVTGQDFPGYIGLYLQDRHIFCRDRVRYVGDPAAGVAAITEEIAEPFSAERMKNLDRRRSINTLKYPSLQLILCSIKSIRRYK